MSSGNLSFRRCWNGDREVLPTDFQWNGRPLVVIDPDDREQVERLIDLYQSGGNVRTTTTTTQDMQAALREFANPQPPKPQEPTDVGCVVEDSSGRFWTKATHASATPWGEVGDLRWRAWEDIDVVRVVVGP